MQIDSVMTPTSLNAESSTLSHLNGTNHGSDVEAQVGVESSPNGAHHTVNDARLNGEVEEVKGDDRGDNDGDVKMNSQEKSVVSRRDCNHC